MKDRFRNLPMEKKERIIQAAVRAFAENGYENANTNYIAKDANISVGSLFQYFENKEDSFFETVEKILYKIIEESKRYPDVVKLYYEMSSPNKGRLTNQVVDQLEHASMIIYFRLIEKAKKENIIGNRFDAKAFAFLMDNLFMMLQYSYSCDYYNERLKLYLGENVMNEDDFVVEQVMKFVRGAFTQ